MGVVQLETDDDIFELSVITGKRAKALFEHVRVTQRCQFELVSVVSAAELLTGCRSEFRSPGTFEITEA